ncbi:TetR-like C-terminal domain-containing protein [Fundicoccus culcitae]|uniref:TetR family transcriptional regulator C-terminal domain-containing protein n=1 Tax=Fundicoccus culcitae TaxID=2969821 RepID=A0ABY5P9S3_9LACT|nr:TetR-like C-terminal domain-containing protein [Fundicoccus culcitae]UUX35512.1 TetR family transcriptional regulator C-terminal domain-containing protein [Fundicoccus culcitae]
MFTYSGQNSFKKYLKDHTVNLVEKIYCSVTPHLRAEFEQQPNNYNLLITIYANGIVESTIDWILNEPESSEEQFSKNIINYINILLDSLDEFAENTQ